MRIHLFQKKRKISSFILCIWEWAWSIRSRINSDQKFIHQWIKWLSRCAELSYLIRDWCLDAWNSKVSDNDKKKFSFSVWLTAQIVPLLSYPISYFSQFSRCLNDFKSILRFANAIDSFFSVTWQYNKLTILIMNKCVEGVQWKASL